MKQISEGIALIYILLSLALMVSAGIGYLVYTGASSYNQNPQSPVEREDGKKETSLIPSPTKINTPTPNAQNPSPTSSPKTQEGSCVVTGCNREICADQPTNSICVYRPEYECYKNATCNKMGGKCSWIMTEELRACLESYQ